MRFFFSRWGSIRYPSNETVLLVCVYLEEQRFHREWPIAWAQIFLYPAFCLRLQVRQSRQPTVHRWIACYWNCPLLDLELAKLASFINGCLFSWKEYWFFAICFKKNQEDSRELTILVLSVFRCAPFSFSHHTFPWPILKVIAIPNKKCCRCLNGAG